MHPAVLGRMHGSPDGPAGRTNMDPAAYRWVHATQETRVRPLNVSRTLCVGRRLRGFGCAGRCRYTPRPMESALRNRLTYGPLMLASLIGLLVLDHYVEVHTRGMFSSLDGGGIKGSGLLVILLAIAPPAVIELARLFAAVQVRPYRLIASMGCSGLVLHAFALQFPLFGKISTSTLALILVFVMFFAALRRARLRQAQQAIHHMAGTVLATLYLGLQAWFLMALRVKESNHFSGTMLSLLMILLVVKSTDIGAFFGGRALGRHKLIPWLSPGKTWEGLICGVITSAIVGAVFARWMPGLMWWKGAVFGLVIGGIGQAGDLLESLMKRDADIKDSGNSIPGFGGVLDVIDSPLLASPFAYILFSVF